MTETMNAWRSQPQTWMDPQSLQTVNAIKTPQEYHQACKSKFGTMLFQIIGNKALVELLVRFPICSAAQPASVLKTFPKDWQNIRDSPMAIKAREDSQPKMEPRLSKQIYHLKTSIERAQWIAKWIQEDSNNWYQLSKPDRNLWVEYNNGNLERMITELRPQQQQRGPKYSGAAQSMMSSKEK